MNEYQYEKAKEEFRQKLLKENPKPKSWENSISYILKGNSGVFYENKAYPQDYTFSTKDYKIQEANDEDFRKLREELFVIKEKITKKDASLFYFGEVYQNKEVYEFFFERGIIKENGKKKEEMPESIKFKIESNFKTFFESNNSSGVIVILKCQPKNIVLFVDHSNMIRVEEKISSAFKEFDFAFSEFFKNKPKPKTDEEDRKQMEEFNHWYNYERKQSDTGKTPAEMYKEIYGKEPPQNFPTNSEEPSRMMNFEWDENYKEPDELLQEADELINKGKYEKALKCVDEVLEIIEDDEIILMKAEILNYLGRFEEAEKYLKKVDKSKNTKAYTSFYRAQRYMFEGNFARASKYMKEAYEQEPDNFDFVIGLASYLYIENDKYYNEYVEKAKKIDKKRAERFLKKSWFEPKELMKGPFVVAVLDCVNKLMEEDKIKEAEKNLSLLIMYEHYLDKGIIKVIRGLQIECLLAQKRFDEELIKIEELIGIDKNNPHAYFYKAQVFFENSKFDDALVEIDKCLKIAEKGIPHPDFFLLKSMILKKQDNDEYIYYENKSKELMEGQKVLRDALKEFIDKDKI